MRIVDDYLRLLQSLLPRGKLWTRFLNARLTEYLRAQAGELTRIDNRAQQLLIERSTLTTTELISDHEFELGLPDECTSATPLTLTERRKAANAKLISVIGQQDPNYFVQIAKAYGFDSFVTEYTPAWCGVAACGDPCGPQVNLFYWKLTLFTSEVPIIAVCGEAVCGDAIQKISELINTVFCFANKYKPAHTILLIGLEGAGFDAGFDVGFDSTPSQSVDYLSGGFDQGFSLGYNVNLGGAFSNGFDIGFNKPA
jgi:uncharacterized protein YmfQ (DUF2313 family)